MRDFVSTDLAGAAHFAPDEPRELPHACEYDDPVFCPDCGEALSGSECVCGWEYDDPRWTDYTLPGNV